MTNFSTCLRRDSPPYSHFWRTGRYLLLPFELIHAPGLSCNNPDAVEQDMMASWDSTTLF